MYNNCFYYKIGTAMNYNELVKLLKQAGWRFYRSGKGSHQIWRTQNGKINLPFPITEARR